MKALYVVSTESFSGKSGIILCLALKLKKNRLDVGFMKPVSTAPCKFEGVSIDEDAYCIWKSLRLKDPLGSVSPVALTSKFMRDYFQGRGHERSTQIMQAFQNISKDKDIVMLEGAGGLHKGRFLELSAPQIAEMFDAKVLLIGKAYEDTIIDEILATQDAFKNRLIVVILNYAPRDHIEHYNELVLPTLKAKGITVFGIIPEDKILQAVTVGEIAEHLGGQILCAHQKVDELVEEFMVGAMSQEHALRYFRRKPNKAVITGGDRADVQLAALETPTKCLVLTGSFQPSPIILSRAQDLEVPVILVDLDTYTAVDRMEALIGHMSMHEQRKIGQMGRLIEEHVALKDLFKSIDIEEYCVE